jgi:CRP-like cAMP-binding protein
MKSVRLKELMPGYAKSEIDQILLATRSRQFSPGSLLYREGTAGTSCFLLTSGSLEVVKSVNGEERVLATMRPGSLVGQSALVTGSLRSASLRAKTKAVTLEIRRRTFQNLLKATQPFALRMQEQIAVAGIRKLRATTARLAMVLANSVGGPSKGSGALDREALSYISACTGEWDMPIGGGGKTSSTLARKPVS